MYRIKICGVTTVEDARQAVRHGADAIGVNFWRHGPRWVSRKVARQIALEIRPAALLVGVFVDCSASEILDTANTVGIDLIQLHGHEAGALVRQLDRPVVQAIRGDSVRPDAVRNYLREAMSEPPRLAGLLVDAAQDLLPGGTGELADWQAARALIDQFPQLPIGLAGGLTAGNVGEAIWRVRPAAVDVASGVEVSPGTKSESQMALFIDAARRAFDDLEGEREPGS